MKRAFAAVLILLVFFSSFAGIKAGKIMDDADEIVYKEEVIYGDRSVLKGLNLNFNSEFGYYYYGGMLNTGYVWENVLAFDESDYTSDAKLEYKFAREDIPADDRINLFLDMRVDYAHYESLIKKYPDLSGENSTDILVPAREVFDHYPIEIEVKTGNTVRNTGTSVQSIALRDYFKFKLPEGAKVRIFKGAGKNGFNAGYFEGSGNNSGYIINEIPLNGTSRDVKIGDSLYFYINLISTETGLLEYDTYEDIPGGYGIYKLDIHNITYIEPESIDTVYSFDRGQEIIGMLKSGYEEIVNALVAEEGKIYLYTIDLKEKNLLKKQEIPADSANIQFVQDEEGYLLIGTGNWTDERLCSDGKVLLFKEDERGIPAPFFTADLSKIMDDPYVMGMFISGYDFLSYDKKYMSCLKDGRLYLIFRELSYDAENPYKVYGQNGISIAVFDESGPLYFGTYGSSLNSPARHMYYSNPKAGFE